MHAGFSDEELDRLVDTTRRVLRAQTRIKLAQTRERLESIESINWRGVKDRMHERFRLRHVTRANSGVEESEAPLMYLLSWLEELVRE